MPTVNPYSDGTPITVTPSGLADSGFDLVATVSGPSWLSATAGVVFSLQTSADGTTYGDAGPILDGNGTFEVFPGSTGASNSRTISVKTPGALSATVTARNRGPVPLSVTVETNAF